MVETRIRTKGINAPEMIHFHPDADIRDAKPRLDTNLSRERSPVRVGPAALIFTTTINHHTMMPDRQGTNHQGRNAGKQLC